jgi:hypothetical protein
MVVLDGGATIAELRMLRVMPWQGGESGRVSESHSWMLGWNLVGTYAWKNNPIYI